MFTRSIFALALGTASISIIAPAQAAEPVMTAVDPAKMKLAEEVVMKLVPPGTYQTMMREMASGEFIQQIMGMDAAALAGVAGENSEEAAKLSGKSLIDLAAEKDPHFKERMDITMKVMFEELGTLFNKIEPDVRKALAQVYVKKYDMKQLADIKSFFGTESGNAFAAGFMSNFMDKDIMSASMKAVPIMMESMPEIMKKVEAATAHLPPAPRAKDTDAPAGQAESDRAADDGSEPWYSRQNWAIADQKKLEQLEIATDKANSALLDFELVAIERARQRYVKQGWKPAPENGEKAEAAGTDRATTPPAVRTR